MQRLCRTFVSKLLFLGALPAGAQRGDSLALIARDRAVESAMLAGDVVELERLLASGFQYTHGDGKRDTRESWITSQRTGRRRFASRTTDSVVAELHGSIGVTSGRARTVRAYDGGRTELFDFRYVRVYRKDADGWVLLSHRSFLVGQ
jgi:hypothetical protein